MAALNSKVKAVIPVAGLGTRMLPATKAIPKEMLPLVDKPLIQYVVNECIAAGITEIVLVTHSSKNSIENHFDTSFELEAMLENALSVSFWRRFSLFALRMSLLCRYVKGWQRPGPCRIVRASRCRKRTCRCYSARRYS